jgi:phage gp36-like protein
MFLTTEDFQKVIKADNLATITTANPTLLMDMADVAVAEVGSYLSGRHDVAQAFSTEGEARNPLLVLRCLDIATYHLHAQFQPRNVPEFRRDRYAEAISWLKGIGKGIINIDLPLKEIEAGQTRYMLFSPGTRFNVR